jgi:hypothetical protein
VRVRLFAALAGAALFVTGVAFIFWPAALLVAGAGLLAFGLLTDDGGKA